MGVVIAVGLDVVDLDRFRAAVERTPGLLDRLFTAGERTTAAERRDPIPSLAARFAAKEAVMKALGVGLGAFAWTDVEVGPVESGAPTLALSGAAAARAGDAGVIDWHLSLTHSGLVAAAVVLAVTSGVRPQM